ncbi:FAD/FMN-containing dehydrogenase [Metapseudomonas boanensis]|uniref:FAD/FMN-containing dehydrogenase n=1 Tax=Metapseudomonas boanensis TaxID=2822138 RepID=A0ABS5XF79_9GAMM|nr:FAD/FMN-containing dehydrogenase [Pseudomonas boanensis]MBT8766320.1 FAD/FMN-containing dehydrogenase [Pseudomonas boanensis]
MRIGLGLALWLLASLCQALEQGERLAPWTLLDQFEQPYSLNDELQVLLVARSMDGAKLVKGALEGQPKGYLEGRRTVFVADISRMPALVSKLFALPAMRDYNYRVLLDRESRVVSRYPGDEAKVLWLRLDHGALVEQREYDSAAALREALESLAP